MLVKLDLIGAVTSKIQTFFLKEFNLGSEEKGIESSTRYKADKGQLSPF